MNGPELNQLEESRGAAIQDTAASAAGAQPRPRVHSVAIELGTFCNQHCDYCYNPWRETGGSQPNGEDAALLLRRVERVIDACALDHVTLTGGEPLAHPSLFPLLRLLRARGVPAQMISNGGLVTDAIAEQLARFELRFVQVTLNGATRAQHEAHVGRGHFDRTLRGIRALTTHGVTVAGCVVLTRKNVGEVGQILELFQGLGVRQIALSRFSPAGYATKNVAALLPSRTDLVTAFEQALPFARTGGMTLACTMPVPPCTLDTTGYAPIQFGGCSIGTRWQEFALGTDGRLRHCTLHAGGVPQDVDVADASVDVAALFTAPALAAYRRRGPSFCHGCQHEQACGGGCGAAAEWVLGSRERVDPFVAQYVDDAFRNELTRRREGVRRLEVMAE